MTTRSSMKRDHAGGSGPKKPKKHAVMQITDDQVRVNLKSALDNLFKKESAVWIQGVVKGFNSRLVECSYPYPDSLVKLASGDNAYILRQSPLARLLAQSEHAAILDATFAGFTRDPNANFVEIDWEVAWEHGLIGVDGGLDKAKLVVGKEGVLSLDLNEVKLDIVYSAPITGEITDNLLMNITVKELLEWSANVSDERDGTRAKMNAAQLGREKARLCFLAMAETLLLYQMEGRIVDTIFTIPDE